MEDVKVINIDGKSYIVSDEIKLNDIKYVYLTNENDLTDFYIQKVIVKDNEEYLEYLDSEDEFDDAMKEFLNKHQKELEEY